jgi:hypothetical protein
MNPSTLFKYRNRTALRVREYELKNESIAVCCPHCDLAAKLINGQELADYTNIRSYEQYQQQQFWFCTSCYGYTGCHETTHYPKGSIANHFERELRKRAHTAFDRLWKDKHMSRKEAYLYLQNITGLEPEDAHIGEMNVSQLETLLSKL